MANLVNHQIQIGMKFITDLPPLVELDEKINVTEDWR